MSSIVIKKGTTLEVKVTAHAVLNSKNQSITYTDGTIREETLPVGSAIDLTGYTIKFILWDSNEVLESGIVTPVIEKTIGNGINITDIAAGEFVLSLTAEETGRIPLIASSYSSEFSFTDLTGDVIKSTTIPILVEASGT